jgi:DNA modification methylase
VRVSEGRRWKLSIIGHGEVDPRTLTRHPQNPKVHPVEQDVVVEASLRELGWLRGVLLNQRTGHVLDGHERMDLAIRRGEQTVPYDLVDIPEEDEGKALMLLDPSGQLARTHLGHWAALAREAQTAEPVLRAFWEKLAGEDADDDEGIGRESPEGSRDGGLALEGSAADLGDQVVGLQEQWATGPGQGWRCGPHLVYCGDSTEAGTWEGLRQRVGRVRGCVTSPPYAMQRAGAYGGVLAEEYVAWLLPVAEQLRATLSADGSWFLNLKEHSEGVIRPVYVHELVVALVQRQGWVYIDEYCWERAGVPGDPVGRGKFKNQWEPVFWLAREARPLFYPQRALVPSAAAFVDKDYQPGLGTVGMQGSGRDFLGKKARRGDGWAYPGNRLPSFGTAEALGHPAAFPVGLAQWFIEIYSEVGDWWVDPFLGSGSTLVACAATGRRGVGIERDAGYVAVALERLRKATGMAPERLE